MTERKFTPPTSFPAQYRNGKGEIITLIGKGIGQYPYIGQNRSGAWFSFADDGRSYESGTLPSSLHDMPKTQIHWANDYGDRIGNWHESRDEADWHYVYGRIAVIRREWTEGEAPKYFTEEVTND